MQSSINLHPAFISRSEQVLQGHDPPSFLALWFASWAILTVSFTEIIPCFLRRCLLNWELLSCFCYDLNEFNSGCNERQRLEGEKGIINELVKRKEYRSITTLLIRLGLPRVTINGVGLSNYDRGV
jgi:hypothetical protein